MQPQAADGSEQDDFFLASDEDDPGAAAVGSAAIDTSDAAAFERAADAAASKQPAGLHGAAGIGSHSRADCSTRCQQLYVEIRGCK